MDEIKREAKTERVGDVGSFCKRTTTTPLKLFEVGTGVQENRVE